MRAERHALHFHHGALAAMVLHPGRRPEDGVRVDLSFLLGTGGRDRRLHRHVGPALDQQDRRRAVSQRWRWQRLGRSEARISARAGGEGLHAVRSRSVSEPRERLLRPDRRVQGAEGGDPDRRGDPAGLHHLLDASQAARVQPEDRLGRQGPAVPGGCRGAGRGREQPVVGNLVVAQSPVQEFANRDNGRRVGRGAGRRRRSGNGRSAWGSSMRSSRLRSTR